MRGMASYYKMYSDTVKNVEISLSVSSIISWGNTVKMRLCHIWEDKRTNWSLFFSYFIDLKCILMIFSRICLLRNLKLLNLNFKNQWKETPMPSAFTFRNFITDILCHISKMYLVFQHTCSNKRFKAIINEQIFYTCIPVPQPSLELLIKFRIQIIP